MGRLALFLLISVLAGCVEQMSAEQLRTVSNEDLADATARAPRNQKIGVELDRRQLFTRDEWWHIEHGEIQIGMSELAVRASWGRPRDVDEYTSSLGTQRTFYYGDVNSRLKTDHDTVFFVDGKVTSWHKSRW